MLSLALILRLCDLFSSSYAITSNSSSCVIFLEPKERSLVHETNKPSFLRLRNASTTELEQHHLCWNDCSNSDIPRATSSAPRTCHLRLAVQRMVRNESLVAADVSWTVDGDCNPSASQCLVTWEVSGGGLMGNLLTESPSVQLSLWPDTNYRVQVTCRSKHTSFLMRSAPLILSTAGAVAVGSTSTTVRPLSEIAEGDDDEALARELDDDSRQTTNRLDPWPVARESEILALFVAMLLFLLVLLAVALLVKWRPASDRSEKDVLVDHEAMVEILHV
ncbi:transmembrane protein fend-like [Anopheles nili]|uniref:transmembrane protein fend-like n=1 Tax=Anopheles nili TaxID=185578 RepID=UPI00237BB0EB|nr:transmembrane protein fend-like [Anopheles nili]